MEDETGGVVGCVSFLLNGPERHFDTLFRHLHFDSTEVIRDVYYHKAQILAAQTLADARRISLYFLEPRRNTPGDKRYLNSNTLG